MMTMLQAVSGAFSGHMEEYAGAQTPASFGDVRAEYSALRQGCGISFQNWRTKIGLRGSDRVRWLNGMITNNIRDLAAGRGVYSFLLNAQGRILGDLHAYNLGDRLIIDTDQSQRDKIVSTFDHFIIMDDVEIEGLRQNIASVGVAGPKSKDILARVFSAVPALEPLQVAEVAFQNNPVRLVRGGDPAYEEFELWIAPEHENTLWNALVEAGATRVGSQAVELHRITRGIPRYGVDLRERDLPQETEQFRALNFNKGCYVGQEIVERIRSRGNVHRTFTGFRIHGPVPPAGAKIVSEGKEVGEVTSTAELPVIGVPVVALGYIRREAIATNRPFTINGIPAAASSLPFTDLPNA